MRRVCVLLAFAVGLRAQDADPGQALQNGIAQARAGHLDIAEQILRDSTRAFPIDKRFLIELAGVLYREKHNDQAKRYLHEALRIDSADEYANEFLGILYWLDGNTEAALKYWNRIEKPLIQDVQLSPTTALNPELAGRAIAVSGGQIFTVDRLLQIEANLNRLDAFVGYSVDLTQRADQRYDTTIRLDTISQPTGGWAGALLPWLRGLPYETLYFDRYNVGRRAINLTSMARWDASKRRIGAELAGPLRLDPRYRYRLIGDARDERWNLAGTYRGASLTNLRVRRIEAGADLVVGLSAKLDWTTELRVVRRWFDEADHNQVFTGGWSAEQRERFDYLLLDLPEHRLRASAAGAVDTGRLFASTGSAYSTVSGDFRAAWFPQARGETWEIDGRMRAAKTFGLLPFDEFLQVGMERDNDLWFRGIAGTRNGQKGSAPMGTNYALSQADLSRTVFHQPFVTLRAGPFFDVASVSGPSAQFGSQGWLSATGIQARIATLDRVRVSLVYGRDLRSGRGVFYTSVTR